MGLDGALLMPTPCWWPFYIVICTYKLNDVGAMPQATGRQLEYSAEAEQTAPDDMRQTDAEGMEAMEVDMSLTGSAQVSRTQHRLLPTSKPMLQTAHAHSIGASSVCSTCLLQAQLRRVLLKTCLLQSQS